MGRLNWFRSQGASLSYVGLISAGLFFSASLTPSLLPRKPTVEGLLAGMGLALGYGVGVMARWVWHSLELPAPRARLESILVRTAMLAVLLLSLVALRRSTIWQDSIRVRMEMPPVEGAYPILVALIALTFGAALVGFARLLGAGYRWIDRQLHRLLPRRLSNILSALVLGLFLLLVLNRVIARSALQAADKAFLELDQYIDEGIEPPADSRACGSAESLVSWDSIGRRGKHFIVGGPTEEEISACWGRDALRPLRVYVGLGTRDTPEHRAALALEELKRAGGFERSLLVVATPTGTGWLDPGAVDTLEYVHRGDTAIVSMQYSYLPSWITILVEPEGSRRAAKVLFRTIYDYWRTLPHDHRPKLYLHGLSLGALGSESCADLFTLFNDPIQGGLWSGPPFPSTKWMALTRDRNPGSPAWLPVFRDGAMVRFTGRENSLQLTGKSWGKMRFVYLQQASDPMTFFAPELLYRRPDWLIGERGPDVSPYLDWYPIVTFLQVAFDLPMATSVPSGYGHNFAAASYIDAWIAVTQPDEWTVEKTTRLKRRFAD